MASKVSRTLPLLLATAGPLLVLFLAYQILSVPPKLTGDALEFEQELAESDPRILVVGSSVARRDVDMEILAERLGVRPNRMLMLTLPNATGAHFYSVLKNRVYEKGYSPRGVIIVSALGTFLTTEVVGDSNMDRLVNQLGEDEPVIAEKVFGMADGGDFRYRRIRARAGELRTDFTSFVRDATVGFLFQPKGRGFLKPGQDLAVSSSDAVFANENMDFELFGDKMGMPADSDEDDYDREVDPWDSFMVDIVELTQEHGSKVVFVRTPFPPSNKDKDLVEPEIERETVSMLSEIGGGYLDFRSLQLDDSYFEDMVHMNPEGAGIMTNALSDALLEMQVFDADVMPTVDMPLVPTAIYRQGPLPSMPNVSQAKREGCVFTLRKNRLGAISDTVLEHSGSETYSPAIFSSKDEALVHRNDFGSDCTGSVWSTEEGTIQYSPVAKNDRITLSLSEDVPQIGPDGEELYWIYPGTSLKFDFDQGWNGPEEAFEIYVIGNAFGEGDPLEVRVDGTSYPLTNQGERHWVSAHPPAPKQAWTLEIASPQTSKWMMVQNVAIGMKPKTQIILGRGEDMYGASVRVLGGRAEHTGIHPEFRSPPPMVDAPRAKKGPAPGLGVFELPRLKDLADSDSPTVASPNMCSPFRVTEDDVPLKSPYSACDDVASSLNGRFCHSGDAIYFSASDTSNPMNNERMYRLQLDESRLCPKLRKGSQTPLRDIWWLYPGDQLSVSLPPERLGSFFDGANRLEMIGEVMAGKRKRDFGIRLLVDGEPVLEESVSSADLKAGKEWLLDPPLPPRTEDVVIEISNPHDDNYLLMSMIALSETYDRGRLEYSLDVSRQGDGAASESEETLSPDRVVQRPQVGLPAGLFPPSKVQRMGRSASIGQPSKPRADPNKSYISRADLTAASSISNTALAEKGLGWWSPLQLSVAGRPLTAQPYFEKLTEDCGDCFVHMGKGIRWTTKDGSSELPTASLADVIPAPTVDGADVYWLYPRTRAKFDFDGWDHDRLIVTATVLGFGSPTQAPQLVVAGESVPVSKGKGRKTTTLDVKNVPTGPWSIEISTPDSAAWYMLLGLTVSQGESIQPVFLPEQPTPSGL
jgi:hypothetical protein